MGDRTFPKEWALSKLGDIAEWGSGGTPSRKETTFYNGNIPWVKTGDLGPKVLLKASESISESGLKNSSAKLFPKGSVVIAMYGATIGKTSILGIDATTNQACAVGQPVSDLTSTTFLYYFLLNEKDNFIAKGKGGAQPNISQGLIKDHDIPLPPLAEQKVIAEKLDTLLAQVETTKARLERIPDILKRFRQSVLAAAVSGKLTEDWRENNAGIDVIHDYRAECTRIRQNISNKKKAKIAELAETPDICLPRTWSWHTLDESCLKITDGTHHSPKSYTEGDFMYVTSKNVREGYIDLSNITYVDENTHREIYSRCDVKEGDVLYVKDGANTGLACVNNIKQEISLLSSVGVLKTCNFMDPTYVQHYLNSPIGRKLMLGLMGGTAIKRLTLTKICQSPIPIPPLEEQLQITLRIKALFSLADCIAQHLEIASARVDNLTQSILAKAFRGELTADWRTAYPELITGENSAEALLEKIRAERYALRKQAKPKRKATKRKVTT